MAAFSEDVEAGLESLFMSLRLAGLRVFIPATASAPVLAQRLKERGARPVVGEISSFVSDATLEHPYALAVIPADASATVAEAVEQHAQDIHIPVDDQRGDARRQGFHGAPGVVTLVGGGPGHPDLITVAGARAVAEADVIMVDHLGPYELAERAGAQGAQVVDVSKLPYGRHVSQQRTNEMLVEYARAGKNVVRLKGGDPFVFGRGFEEWEALSRAGIPVRVIPGVTSVTSAAASAGFSVTRRGVNHDVTIVSGHVAPGDPRSVTNWEAVARMRGTVVLIMAVHHAAAIAQVLMDTEGGRSARTPAVVIEDASMESQRVTRTTVGELGEVMAKVGVKPPAIILIGEAVAEAMEFVLGD